MRVIDKLADILDDFGESPNAGTYYANCPFCVSRGEARPDTRRRLGITLRGDTKAAHCFNCGWRGTVTALLRELGEDGIKLRDVKKAQGLTPEKKQSELIPVGKPEGFLPIDDPRCHVAREYMQDRGFDLDLMRRYGFGYARHSYFARRLIIPIRFKNKTVGYQGRLLVNPSKGGRKYLFTPNFDASKMLFNFDNVRERDEVVIVEGVFDCLRHLSDRAVALFTNKMSDRQRLLLIKGFKKIVVMLDAGFEKESLAIVKQLSGFVETRIAVLPDGEDPASATERQVKETLDSATSPSLRMLMSHNSTTIAHNRRSVV